MRFPSKTKTKNKTQEQFFKKLLDFDPYLRNCGLIFVQKSFSKNRNFTHIYISPKIVYKYIIKLSFI